MAVGASLWGAFNQSAEHGWTVTKAGNIGCQYGYVNLTWSPGSPVFDKARATGLQGRRLAGRHPRQSGRPALLR